jgi:hypothetical protein
VGLITLNLAAIMVAAWYLGKNGKVIARDGQNGKALADEGRVETGGRPSE